MCNFQMFKANLFWMYSCYSQAYVKWVLCKLNGENRNCIHSTALRCNSNINFSRSHLTIFGDEPFGGQRRRRIWISHHELTWLESESGIRSRRHMNRHLWHMLRSCSEVPLGSNVRGCSVLLAGTSAVRNRWFPLLLQPPGEKSLSKK
jgi:hypothetical protein